MFETDRLPSMEDRMKKLTKPDLQSSGGVPTTFNKYYQRPPECNYIGCHELPTRVMSRACCAKVNLMCEEHTIEMGRVNTPGLKCPECGQVMGAPVWNKIAPYNS